MNKLILMALLATMMVAPTVEAGTVGKKIQCWNDKNGNRMCGDRVPPEYAGEQREVLQDGRVVETRRGAKTPEEIAEEERLRVEAEEAKRRAEYDRSLLESYRNMKDIENMRDERLAMLDSRIRAAEKSTLENQKTLEDLRARQASAKAADPAAAPAAAPASDKTAEPKTDKLTRQVRQYQKSLVDSQKSLERLKNERAQTEAKFDSDMKRYNELSPPVAKKKPG